MANREFALGRDQRAEILKAATAIERQLKDLAGKPHWQVLYVIGTNLAIIRANASNLRRISSN